MYIYRNWDDFARYLLWYQTIENDNARENSSVCGQIRVRWHILTCTVTEPSCSHPTWWRHQMKTFSVLLAICAGNSPVPGDFPAQRPVTRSFGVFFDLRRIIRLNKQSWGWWFETLSRPLWRHSNDCGYTVAVHYDKWDKSMSFLNYVHPNIYIRRLICLRGSV